MQSKNIISIEFEAFYQKLRAFYRNIPFSGMSNLQIWQYHVTAFEKFAKILKIFIVYLISGEPAKFGAAALIQ